MQHVEHIDDINEPYCSNCKYQLTGLTESSKCPECGRPIVEVLVRPSWRRKKAKRYRSQTTIFGLPFVDVATGPKANESIGRAKGIIAIGDTARGVLAIGGVARGVIAIGFVAIGVVGFGACGIGLIVGLGGLGIGGIAAGSGAVGIAAQGAGVAGVIANGVAAYGYLARGEENAVGRYTVTPSRSSPGADQLVTKWAWLIGPRVGSFRLILWAVAAATVVTLLTALVILGGYVGSR